MFVSSRCFYICLEAKEKGKPPRIHLHLHFVVIFAKYMPLLTWFHCFRKFLKKHLTSIKNVPCNHYVSSFVISTWYLKEKVPSSIYWLVVTLVQNIFSKIVAMGNFFLLSSISIHLWGWVKWPWVETHPTRAIKRKISLMHGLNKRESVSMNN